MLHLLRKITRPVSCIALLGALGYQSSAQSFTNGNLAVLRVGDGSATPTNAATPIFIVEFTPSGAATTNTIALPSTGTTKITNSGTATSEGFMELSAEHDRLVLAGYDAAAGTTGVASTTAVTVNRELFTVNSGGSYTKVASTASEYSGNNIRSGTASGANYFSAGATNGVELLNTSTQLTASTTKARVIQIINGQTYFTSNDNPTYDGLDKLGTGIPTTGGQTTTLISTASTSPFGFAISPDGNTMYMADDGLGVTKYTKSGSTFVSAYLVNNVPARGLAVDFSGTNPVIYATTTAGTANTIIKMVDAGSATTSTVIATAPANTVYQGITFTPSCFASVSALPPTTFCGSGSTKIVIKGNPNGVVSYNINGGSTLTTTIGNNGYDTLSTGTLTSSATYNLVSITTTACSSVALSGSATVTVNPNPAAITGISSICTGTPLHLSDATGGGTWSSTATSVATVNSSGVVSGVSAGNATISYTLSTGCAISGTVTVNTSPAAIGAAVTAVCVGSTIAMSDATAGGTWSSTNTTVATVSSSPVVVSGASAGNTVISYTLSSGCAATASVSVVTSPGAITAPSSICTGNTMSLSDATTGGVWSSNNSAIATVSSSPAVTGVAAGSAVISYVLSGCFTTATVTVNASPAAIAGASSLCTGSTIPLSDATAGGTWSSSNTGVATISSGPVVVSGVTAGSTVISYTLSSGCAATQTVAVGATPSAIAGTLNVCAGATTLLSDTVPGGSWSSDNTSVATVNTSGTVSGVTSGTATITYTSTGGCGSVTATVTVNPLPAAGSISGTTAILTGSATSLSDGASGGTWSSGNTSVATIDASGTVSGVSAGTAVISYTVTNGCGTAVATATVTVTDPSLVGTVTAAINVNVFPNPSKGGFTIKGSLAAGDDNMNIEITDVLGRTVYTGIAKAQNGIVNEQVHTEGLAAGAYIMRLHTENSSKVFRIMIQQ